MIDSFDVKARLLKSKQFSYLELDNFVIHTRATLSKFVLFLFYTVQSNHTVIRESGWPQTLHLQFCEVDFILGICFQSSNKGVVSLLVLGNSKQLSTNPIIVFQTYKILYLRLQNYSYALFCHVDLKLLTHAINVLLKVIFSRNKNFV